MTARQEHTTALRETLATRFSDGELRTLCFDLGIDYDDLPGQGKGDKARELVAHCGRRHKLLELVSVGRAKRPDISWPEWLVYQVSEERDTGFVRASPEKRKGFGDTLTAAFLAKYQDII
jgi:hypothetical protein